MKSSISCQNVSIRSSLFHENELHISQNVHRISSVGCQLQTPSIWLLVSAGGSYTSAAISSKFTEHAWGQFTAPIWQIRPLHDVRYMLDKMPHPDKISSTTVILRPWTPLKLWQSFAECGLSLKMNMDTFMLSLAIKACVLNVWLLIKENHYTDIQSKLLLWLWVLLPFMFRWNNNKHVDMIV